MLEQKLRESGHWIGDEEFEQLWKDEEEPYKDSPFNLQVVAVGFRKFPSIDAYRKYFRILKSFERYLGDEMTDEALTAHLDRANPMLGLGKVRADMILISSIDDKKARFRLDGWDSALARANECAEKLAGGMEWDEALEEYSDFRDGLVGQSNQGAAPPSIRKGRFPLMHRNELVQRVGESDYWMFLTGTSVVDHVFFTQDVGQIDGPFQGVQGYYITRVVQRVPPPKPLSLENPSQRNLIDQDYLAVRLNEAAAEWLEGAEVVGL